MMALKGQIPGCVIIEALLRHESINLELVLSQRVNMRVEDGVKLRCGSYTILLCFVNKTPLEN